MRSGIGAFLVAATLLFVTATGGSAYACGSGDVDGDEIVRLADALLVLRFSSGNETLTENQLCACNVYGEIPPQGMSECNVLDFVFILKRACGLYP